MVPPGEAGAATLGREAGSVLFLGLSTDGPRCSHCESSSPSSLLTDAYFCVNIILE